MKYSKPLRQFFKNTNFNKRFAKFVRNYSNAGLVSANQDNLQLKVGQNIQQYPLVWLRDNCTCKDCFHQSSYSRIIDWDKFNTDVAVRKIETNKTNDGVDIEWSDDHTSRFTFKWLMERSFSNGNGKAAQNYQAHRPVKALWSGDEFAQIAKKFDYRDVMSSDKSLYNWIKHLAIDGAVLIENASLDNRANKQLADKAAFVRKTHYEEEFRVMSKQDTTNVAYMSSELQLHTDLPYYEYVPGVINLHCITQTDGEGGESLLCDGFYVAERLRRDNKEAFDILSTVKVNWLDIGEDEGRQFRSHFCSPMISLDQHGNVDKIRHSVPQRDSRFSADVSLVKPWYRSLRVFVDMLTEHSSKFKLKPGEMLAFDNTRIVHGRTGYKDSKNNQRVVIGLYMDWDELYSKMMVLEKTI